MCCAKALSDLKRNEQTDSLGVAMRTNILAQPVVIGS